MNIQFTFAEKEQEEEEEEGLIMIFRDQPNAGFVLLVNKCLV